MPPANSPASSGYSILRKLFTNKQLWLALTLAIIFIVASIIFLSNQIQPTIILEQNYRTEYYTLSYVAGWEYQTDEGGKRTFFFSPKSTNDKSEYLVTALVDNIPPGMAVTDYSNLVMDQVEDYNPSTKVIDLSTPTVSELATSRVVYQQIDDIDKVNRKWTSVYIMKGNKVYTFSLVANTDKFASGVSIFDAMIDSLKII